MGIFTPTRVRREPNIMRNKPINKKNITSRIIPAAAWRLTKIKALDNYKVEVEFTDGTPGYVEMMRFIMKNNAGIFSKLKDKALFNQAYIEYGVLTWPGGIDLAPDAMYDAIKQTGHWHL